MADYSKELNLKIEEAKNRQAGALAKVTKLKDELQAVKFTELTKRFPHLPNMSDNNFIGIDVAAEDDMGNTIGYTMSAAADCFEIQIEDDDGYEVNFFKVDPTSLTVLVQMVEDAFAYHYGKKVKLTVSIDE